MATTTPNFGWPVPTSTDLVKDGATAIEALGDGIDTSMVDLKGGTTGQILAKATSADMDFAWITNDVGDITAVTAGTGISGGGTSGAVTITNSMATEITAKGDLIVGTGSATFDNLAAGSNGETLVADSSTSTGLRYQSNFAAGKNKIINGAFDVWQRGTSFASIASNAYFADRFAATFTAGGGTNTFSRQTFTPGAAPVAGYEGSYFARLAVTSGGASTTVGMYQKIEDVRTLAGQTATISFWAKADSARTLSIFTVQDFGSGGSGSVVTSTSTALTTSFVRYTYTVSLASISGKTIGTSSFLYIAVELGAGQASGSVTLDTWGWQVEASNTATAFQTATGTLQGELAACQRYYFRMTPTGSDAFYGVGVSNSTTQASILIPFPVTMRTKPTALEQSGTAGDYRIRQATTTTTCSSVPTLDAAEVFSAFINLAVASGLTAGQAVIGRSTNSSGYLAWSAEL